MYTYPDYRLDPPDQEETVALHCEVCCTAIYIGDTYYSMDGDVWCEECIDNYMRAIRRTA